MKKLLLLSIALKLSLSSFAQTTIELSGPTSCKDVFVDSNRPTENLGGQSEISAYAWTFGGTPVKSRSFLKFSLTDIPANAIITEAKLYLYHHPSPVYANSGGQVGANALFLERVTSTWDELTTNWGNQPTVTATNNVSVAASTSSTQDYEITVTSLIEDMRNDNKGFAIMLQNETPYTSTSWASTEYSDAAKRPKLAITYTIPNPNEEVITFGSDVCKDVFADSNRPTEDLSTQSEIDAYTWTLGGNPVTARTYIRFDMSTLPVDAVVSEAKLFLYNNPSPVYANTGGQVGENALYVSRVTDAWTDATTNWNNQPQTTTSNEVSVAASSSAHQDYSITVTNLVKDMLTNNNYGFAIKLQNESPYSSVTFASSEYSDAAKRPKLEVHYLLKTGITEKLAVKNSIKMYPNPANDKVAITVPDSKEFTLNVYNLNGQLLYSVPSSEMDKTANSEYILDANHFRGNSNDASLYLLMLETSNSVYTSRLMCK